MHLEMTNREIKPCPWCNGTDISYQVRTEDREGIPLNAICEECAACSPWEYVVPTLNDDVLMAYALKLWNDRGKAEQKPTLPKAIKSWWNCRRKVYD